MPAHPKRLVADLLSATNLACGIASAACAVAGRFEVSLLLLLVGAACDGLDGAAARRWGGTRWGVLSDDIADGVNYGIAPGVALARGPRHGTVIYLHGITDNRASGIWVAERLVPSGFDVLAYDSRAHGDSTGDVCTYGFHEKRDLSRVIDRLGSGPFSGEPANVRRCPSAGLLRRAHRHVGGRNACRQGPRVWWRSCGAGRVRHRQPDRQ